MLMYFLILINLSLTGASSVLQKKFQLGVKNDTATLVFLNLVNTIFGSLYFLFLCKFNIEMNMVTFVFSFLYALLVLNSVTLGVVTLSKMSILMSSVVGMAGSVFGAVVIGRVFFDEKITINSMLAVTALMAAVIIPYIGDVELKQGKKSLPVAIWSFVSSAVTGSFLKFYTVNENTLHSNNLFFMTNFICLIFCVIFVIIYKSVKTGANYSFNFLKISQVANIGVRTAISNVASILSVIIIASMPLSVYTIVTSAAGLVLNTVISKFMFGEILNKKNYIALALSIFSVVIGAI